METNPDTFHVIISFSFLDRESSVIWISHANDFVNSPRPIFSYVKLFLYYQ